MRGMQIFVHEHKPQFSAESGGPKTLKWTDGITSSVDLPYFRDGYCCRLCSKDEALKWTDGLLLTGIFPILQR